MKKVIFIPALFLFGNFAGAQTLKENEVPAAVKGAFAKSHGGAKADKWEKENGNFEAGYKINGKEFSVLMDAQGAVIETEEEIAVTELPRAVIDYVKEMHKGAKIKEASKITDAQGMLKYEADIGKEDLIFDSNGNFLKSEKDLPDKENKKR
jgi:hypothetical protein